MKKYTLITTTIALFFASQLASMDKNPSTANLKAFETSLKNKLQREGFKLFEGNSQFPIFKVNYIPDQWGQFIRDTAQKDSINKTLAKGILLNAIMDRIVQEIIARTPGDADYATAREICNTTYYRLVASAAHMVFFDEILLF